MYDLSKALNDFYEQHVLLSADSQGELRDKRDTNIDRLKSGLEDYNEEHNTSYKIADSLTQGSMAMHTIVQNDSNDYDIDVAIIFDKSNIGDMGPRAARNMVADVLKRKCTQLKKDPEVKTNCVRIEYASGYHVDFAIYRRYEKGDDYQYDHAGTDWIERDPKAINGWFADEILEHGGDLRKVIRFSKMFCKSRSAWVNMAAGLIQTVVCDEKFQKYDRIDETFYYTMVAVRNRLENSIEVYNPTDPSTSLLQTQKHREKVENWRKRLSEKLDNLSVLFDADCTYAKAREAWYRFFNHSYWQDETVDSVEKSQFSSIIKTYRDTEQFIEDQYVVDERYGMTIRCTISRDGFRPAPIIEFLKKCWRGRLPHGFSIECEMKDTDAPSYDKILWKVRNVGELAEKKDMIRGQICDRGKIIHEHSDFYGPHYIECYLVKGNRCIARGKIDVPIDNQ